MHVIEHAAGQGADHQGDVQGAFIQHRRQFEIAVGDSVIRINGSGIKLGDGDRGKLTEINDLAGLELGKWNVVASRVDGLGRDLDSLGNRVAVTAERWKAGLGLWRKRVKNGISNLLLVLIVFNKRNDFLRA